MMGAAAIIDNSKLQHSQLGHACHCVQLRGCLQRDIAQMELCTRTRPKECMAPRLEYPDKGADFGQPLAHCGAHGPTGIKHYSRRNYHPSGREGSAWWGHNGELRRCWETIHADMLHCKRHSSFIEGACTQGLQGVPEQTFH